MPRSFDPEFTTAVDQGLTPTELAAKFGISKGAARARKKRYLDHKKLETPENPGIVQGENPNPTRYVTQEPDQPAKVVAFAKPTKTRSHPPGDQDPNPVELATQAVNQMLEMIQGVQLPDPIALQKSLWVMYCTTTDPATRLQAANTLLRSQQVLGVMNPIDDQADIIEIMTDEDRNRAIEDLLIRNNIMEA